MKVKISCEIEADIVDKEEIEAIKEQLESNRPMKPIEHLWKTVLEKKLKEVCPTPIYDNRKIGVEVKYIDKEDE